MERYNIVSCEWVPETMEVIAGKTTAEDHIYHKEKVYQQNMDEFIKRVNEEIAKGWEPHGSPQLSGLWVNDTINFRYNKGVAIQAMVLKTKSKKTKTIHSR